MHTHIHLRTHTHENKDSPLCPCLFSCVRVWADGQVHGPWGKRRVSPTATKYKQYTQQLKDTDAIKSVRSWTHEEKRSITYESFEVFQYICLKFLTDKEINESDAALW